MSRSIEDYLEKIYLFVKENKRPIKTTELAKMLNINPSAITNMAKRLKELGYVKYEPYVGISLTKEGEEIAKKIIEKHQTIKTFLIICLGLNEEEADEEACKLEHVVSDKVLDRLKMFIEDYKKVKH
ncbi:iron dependent repressor [Methanocaldococcus villosus KIN24-T80]|uniref:Iron dependent repressor n=1 Tax=Methanocaldococcus villosus KIN24-T80 TaxID=1069083 RepID=N6W0A6_9EURY|nr:metal-dependent transcriptional regulator [Methanocaldococcus villosus]ENN96802.1 iron dependent repressor [Methanocaldococcus villosus KIN24-T80]